MLIVDDITQPLFLHHCLIKEEVSLHGNLVAAKPVESFTGERREVFQHTIGREKMNARSQHCTDTKIFPGIEHNNATLLSRLP